MKIGILTSYSPSEEDISNIRRVRRFFDFLIVIDNNPLGLSVSRIFCAEKDVVTLSNFNMGGLSGAFNSAKIALKGFERIESATVTLLDQDTDVSEEVINTLITEIKQCHPKSVVGATFSNKNLVGVPSVKRAVSCLPTSTSTMMLVDFLISEKYDIRFPIDLADFVWCWRNVENNNFSYFQMDNVHVRQLLGIKRFKILSREMSLPSPFRHEHQMRAVRHLWSLNFVPADIKIRFTLKAITKLVLYPICCRDGYIRLRYMLRGIFYN